MSNKKVLQTPGHLVSLAARQFAKLSELGLKEYGFSPGQLPVLVALQCGVAATQKSLAAFAKIEQPPMAQMLARMERDGLIVRKANPLDGRSSEIMLTEKAKKQMPEAIDALFDGNIRALKGFSASEKVSFISMLCRLIDNLEEMLK